MFKSATIYKITLPQPMLVYALDAAAEANQFTPCGPAQERSVGWVPPRGHEHGAMIENIGGHLIMKLMIETRTVPGPAVKRAVDEAAQKSEANTGRKPGKKERKEMADEALLALLPHAFPKLSAVNVWIDPAAGRVVLDTASSGLLDLALSELVRLMDGIKVQPLLTELVPAAIMASWLIDGDKLTTHDRFGFDIGRSCELKSTDENKATVRYAKHPLDTDEVRNHLLQGKIPTRLELSYQGRVSFELDGNCALRKINFLDVVFQDRGNHDDAFDADVAILTGEFSKLIPELIEALGGEVVSTPAP